MALNIPNVPYENFVDQYQSTKKNWNALNKQELENKYLPLTSTAKAASELAYSSLLGPQFIAKMMGNNGVLASLSEPQRQAMLQYTTNAGTNAPGGANTNSLARMASSPQFGQNDSTIGAIVNAFNKLMNGGNNQPQQQQSFQQNPPQQPLVQNNSPSQGSGVMMRDNGSVPPVRLCTNSNQV